MVCSETNQDAGIAWCYVFRWISWFCLQHPDSCIHVCLHHAEYTLPVCNQHYRTGLSPRVIAWGAIWSMFWSPLFCIHSTFNSGHNICVMLRLCLYSLFKLYKMLCFSRKYCWYCLDLPWYRKCLAASLAYILQTSLANRKQLINGCQVIGSSLYTSHYCQWTISSCWICMGNCACTCHSIYM